MKFTRSDIYFAGDDSHAFLPWIIGIMASMATLLLCLGITVGGWVVDHDNNYANSFTVNIPSSAENLSEKLPDVINALQKMHGVTNVSQISEDKLRTLLKPWLGTSEGSEALPLPVVFDVTIEHKASVNYKQLQSSLTSIIDGTQVDSHELWVDSFVSFSSALRSLMTILASLIIGGLALMIAFTSRASLKLHSRTVNLLHSIGAEDRYIMRQFQYEAFLVTLRGTVPGCIAAGVAYWSAGMYMASLKASIIPSFSMSLPHFALLVAMPLACGTVATLAARISVFKQLQRVL